MIAALFIVAAATGAIVRWQMTVRLNRAWPVGTFAVNISAAFAAGLLVDATNDVRTVLAVGFLGAVSTFSTLIAELDDPDLPPRHRALYLVATIVGGVGAAWVGLSIS